MIVKNKKTKKPNKCKKITASVEDTKGIQRGLKEFQDGNFVDFDAFIAAQK